MPTDIAHADCTDARAFANMLHTLLFSLMFHAAPLQNFVSDFLAVAIEHVFLGRDVVAEA